MADGTLEEERDMKTKINAQNNAGGGGRGSVRSAAFCCELKTVFLFFSPSLSNGSGLNSESLSLFPGYPPAPADKWRAFVVRRTDPNLD